MIDDQPTTVSRRLPRALTELVRGRTWAELAYALALLPLGLAGFTFSIAVLSVGGSLAVIAIGLPLLAVGNELVRPAADLVRRASNLVTGSEVAAPARRPRRTHGWLRSTLLDGAAWRAHLYLLLALPVGVATSMLALLFWTYGLGATTYPVWRPFTPCDSTTGGRCHRNQYFGSVASADTWWGITLTAASGVVVLLAAPWVVRAILRVDRLAVVLLLGPTAGGAARVEQLERSRASAVDDSAATLRRIERDLHDGAQARMVAVAMNLGLAREKLAEGGDPAALLDTAHASAKQAILELRDLARGIHPPVLDTGLGDALQTLVSHVAVPVALTTAIAERPDPAIETMAYFCLAELLTNAGKHSGAEHLAVDVRTSGSALHLCVEDDGRGGAHPHPGSGLAGLADRVTTVDGLLGIDSPPGGPTRITVEVPLHTRSHR